MATEEKKPRFNSLNIDGVKYRTLLTDTFKKRKPFKEHNPNLLTAFIPGTIVDVYTKKGKKVKEGDILLILEAMKMRNVVMAPHDGYIKVLAVKVGDNVSKNQVMIELG